MKRGLLVLLAFGGIASAAAAAWSTGVLDHRVPLPLAQEKARVPSWAGSDRTFVTEAQNFEARAEGVFDRDVKSVLNVTRPMQYGEYRWDDKNVPKGPVGIRVDLKRQSLSAV